MKYAVIAALLATSNAAELTGCKKGIKTKIYKDAKCEKDSTGTFSALESDLAKTGKCNEHHATDDQKKALKTAQGLLKKSKVKSAEAKDKVEAAGKLTIPADGSNPEK